MYGTVPEQSALLRLQDRQQQAQAGNLAARLAAARKWDKRAAAAARRARLARAAVQ